MTAETLITDLAARGVVLTLAGVDLKIEAPKGELTHSDIETIRERKPELVKLLAVPSRWDEYQDAIARAFANPTPREDIGPQWMTCPDGWPGSRPQAAKPAPGTCDRCGSGDHKDFPIHSGRSIRRDCAQCGRFICWPKWDPPQEPRP